MHSCADIRIKILSQWCLEQQAATGHCHYLSGAHSQQCQKKVWDAAAAIQAWLVIAIATSEINCWHKLLERRRSININGTAQVASAFWCNHLILCCQRIPGAVESSSGSMLLLATSKDTLQGVHRRRKATTTVILSVDPRSKPLLPTWKTPSWSF